MGRPQHDDKHTKQQGNNSVRESRQNITTSMENNEPIQDDANDP